MFAQWDDHEVTNDWSPAGSYDETGYEDDGTPRLVARARRAFFDFMPIRHIGARQGRVYRKIAYGPLLDVFMIDMRSYRDETWNNGEDHRGWILGAEQLAWLKRELAASRATWKVIAADLPIGLISLDAVALGNGPPDRREHEIAELLASIKRAGVRNTVWLTADMHYTAAHCYDPNKAQFSDFEPFWEFVSGPLHAGTWGPGELDDTFGPVAMYRNGCSEAQGDNLAPCFGLQFFGRVDIDGASGVMTVTLKDVDNRDLWSVDIEPSRRGGLPWWRSIREGRAPPLPLAGEADTPGRCEASSRAWRVRVLSSWGLSRCEDTLSPTLSLKRERELTFLNRS